MPVIPLSRALDGRAAAALRLAADHVAAAGPLIERARRESFDAADHLDDLDWTRTLGPSAADTLRMVADVLEGR